MKLPILPAWIWPWGVIAVLVAGIGIQQIRVAGLQADLAEAGKAASDENAQRWSAALAFQQMLDKVSADHAAAQQKSEDAWHAQIAKLETDRARRAADNKRLRELIEAYAGTGDRRPGESDAAALQRAADRLRLVASLLAEGAGLVDEGRGIIERRDAEVGRLLGQIHIDRTVCQPVQ